MNQNKPAVVKKLQERFKYKRWSWTVYSICDAYDAEHVFHSCFRRGYHLDEGECDHAGCV